MQSAGVVDNLEKPKKDVGISDVPIHRIRIILTSCNVNSLERGKYY